MSSCVTGLQNLPTLQAGNKFLCTQMTYRGVAATQGKGVVLAIGPPCKGFA